MNLVATTILAFTTALATVRAVEKPNVIFIFADNKLALQTFHSNGPFRGIKRTMYEGGLRVPMVARWLGRIKPGTVNYTQWAFYDFLPTMADLIGHPLPAGLKFDGISVIPALLRGETMKREFLYWELHEGKFIQAVRAGDWKAVRNGPNQPLELYNLAKDEAEASNVADAYPDIVTRLDEILKREHVPNPLWPDTTNGKTKQ